MAEQQQANPEEQVRELANAVGLGTRHIGLNQARSILADPAPLLEALAEAGVLEVERRREK